MWNKIKSMSLAVKIIGMALSVLLFQAAVSFYNIQNLSKSYKTRTNETFVTYSRNLGQRIAAQFYERYGDVQAFAINDAIQSFNSSAIQAKLDQYVPLYGLYDLIIVIDKHGRLVSVNSKDVAGKTVNYKDLQNFNYSDAVWFKSALKGEFTEDKANGFSGTYVEDFIDDPLMKAAFGEHRFGTSFTTQIKDAKGQVIGVISNRAGKRWFENDLIQVYKNINKSGLNELEIVVVNKNGMIISNLEADKKLNEPIINSDAGFILKNNFMAQQKELADNVSKNKSGYAIATSSINGHEEIFGYHHIENNKWISSLGWTVFFADGVNDAYASVNQASKEFYAVLFIAFIFCFAFSLFSGRTISKGLAYSSRTLGDNAKEVYQAAEKIASSSQQLSVAARQQASALQETVTAVDEITATVQKNSESAERSRDVSSDSISACEKGKKTVQDMMLAITDIETTNLAASNQMNESNIQLTEITKLIHDISNKTKVINEIVFQTKLLSFNASVEAARAGEYGKGFAVVAEEVGNLAKMSGEASKEISILLEQSVHKVNFIVADSKNKVDQMISTSKSKIKTGIDTAAKCNDELEIILHNVQEVDTMITEISTASREQATGIRQISSAFAQMEQVTQQNATIAQASASAGEELKAQSNGLQDIVSDLNHIVFGQGQGNVKDFSNPIAAFKNRANVVPFVKKTANPAPFVSESKKVAGNVVGADFTPSSDDPGFNE